VSFGLCGWIFAGLADFKKMIRGVWGVEDFPRQRAKHTTRLWPLLGK